MGFRTSVIAGSVLDHGNPRVHHEQFTPSGEFEPNYVWDDKS